MTCHVGKHVVAWGDGNLQASRWCWDSKLHDLRGLCIFGTPVQIIILQQFQAGPSRLATPPSSLRTSGPGFSVITFPTAGSASAKKKRPKSVTPTRSAQKNTFRQVATIGRKFSGRTASWPLACENAIKRYPKWAGCQLWPSWHWEAHCHLQTPSTPQSAARASRTCKKLIKSYCRNTHWRSCQSINQSTSTTTSEIYWVEKTCKGAFIDMSSGFCIKDVAKGHQGFTGFTQMDDDPTMTGHKTFQDRPREALQLFCHLGLAFTWRIIIRACETLSHLSPKTLWSKLKNMSNEMYSNVKIFWVSHISYTHSLRMSTPQWLPKRWNITESTESPALQGS